VPHTALMGKKKVEGGEGRTDRHKPSRMVRIKEGLARQLDRIVGRDLTDFTAEVNRAVREMLAREGLWPPPGERTEED
jgi:hypothetical protein